MAQRAMDVVDRVAVQPVEYGQHCALGRWSRLSPSRSNPRLL